MCACVVVAHIDTVNFLYFGNIIIITNKSIRYLALGTWYLVYLLYTYIYLLSTSSQIYFLQVTATIKHVEGVILYKSRDENNVYMLCIFSGQQHIVCGHVCECEWVCECVSLWQHIWPVRTFIWVCYIFTRKNTYISFHCKTTCDRTMLSRQRPCHASTYNTFYCFCCCCCCCKYIAST